MKAARQPIDPGCVRDWPYTGTAHLKTAVPQLGLHSFSKAIEIPASLREQPLEIWQTSARLTAVLNRFGIRVLGDLHGRKVVDFAWEKNCGPKTLYELDLLSRRARFQNGKASRSHRRGGAHASHGSGAAGTEAATAAMQENGANFAIPESVCHLSFHELPITTRLANIVRSIDARRLGDLHGRNAFELLQHKACGWRTISEIQQLIERAVSGEFDLGQIKETTAAAELLSLLEQSLAKLPLRDRQFLLARIGAEMGRAGGPRADLLYLSYAEIGRRYGLTRARVQKVFANTLDSLRKIWGPRVPRLLEVIKWRCLSMICPLTPELLEKWINVPAASPARRATRGRFSSFRLSTKAYLRLIAALDETIPCWLERHHKPQRIDDFVRQFDLALAVVVREGGRHITVAEAYRRLSHPAGRDYRRLPIENFLQMLRSVECTVIEFKDPQSPIIRLRPANAGAFLCEVPSQNGKSSTARKIHSNSPTIQLFGITSMFGEHAGIGPR
jgi:hypothetical protein